MKTKLRDAGKIFVAVAAVSFLIGMICLGINDQVRFEEDQAARAAFFDDLVKKTASICEEHGGIFVKTSTAHKCIKADVLY